MYKVFVVSDGTGHTAEQALRAALTQFEDIKLEVIRRPKTRSETKVRKIISEAKENGGFIVHTLVSDSVRDKMIRLGRQHNVATIDLMGPLLARLSNQFSTHPSEKPGLFSQLNKDYFRRIETMEFAFHHDDGLRIKELRKAEIVIIGVSRTFKTPLSIYLAFKGWFVANIPIIMNVEPPPILFKLPPGRIFCLDTNTRQLVTLRMARQKYLGDVVNNYVDHELVRMELMYARSIFNRVPEWPVINVTSKPIEEIASEILILRNRTIKGRKK